MRIFGKPVKAGRFSGRFGRARLEITIEPIGPGFLVRGTASGRPGRVEILRRPAPPVFLMNNWQSWGPIRKASPGDRFPELETIYQNNSPTLFSPVPEFLARGPVSDYFVAWNGIVMGFLTSKIAHPFFAVEGSDLVGYLDYFDVTLDDPVPLEPLVILKGRSVEVLLDAYALLVKKENRVRLNPWNPVGWCSWYHYFGKLGWKDVLENIRIARKNPKSFPFEVFQVDDGYETEIGDWTRAKPGYPALEGLAGAIREKGFKAGIWTAPTSAAEASELFTSHPEWMVSAEGTPKKSYRGWGKSIYALDTSNEEAKDWLFRTFAALKKAGFEYFKIDFLFSAAMPGSRRKNVTPVQAYREGLEVIREAVGRGFVLGCGAPLLPSVGLVDGMRVGEDTAPHWKTKSSGFQGPNAYFALKNALLRQFMHRRFWTNDPDCLLVRNREIELAENERELFALAAGALDNMLVLSDDLALVDGRGKRLFRKALGLRGGKSRVLGLLEDDGYVIESRGGPAGDFELGVNLSDEVRAIGKNSVGPRSARLR
jgi:alpha-galactosidase